MTNEKWLNHTFSNEQLLALQSFIGQNIEAVFIHKEDNKYYNESKSMIEACFKPKFLVRLSGSYYIFSNNTVFDKFQNEVHKIDFDKFSDSENKMENLYDKIFDLSFKIDKVDVYSSLDQEFGPKPYTGLSIKLWKEEKEELDLYSIIADTLLVLTSYNGEKMAIMASESFLGSIQFYSDTNSIETELLFQIANDLKSPKFYKRIEISYDRIEYLWEV
jgi:hypothetical protein